MKSVAAVQIDIHWLPDKFIIKFLKYVSEFYLWSQHTFQGNVSPVFWGYKTTKKPAWIRQQPKLCWLTAKPFNMQVIFSSETSVDFWRTMRFISQKMALHCCENISSYNHSVYLQSNLVRTLLARCRWTQGARTPGRCRKWEKQSYQDSLVCSQSHSLLSHFQYFSSANSRSGLC